MGIINTFFYDTYALYEIIEGNPNYKIYTKNVGMIITKLNLMELYYGLLIKYDKKIAEKYYNELLIYTAEFNDETLKKAMQFKAMNKKKKLSYIDCLGYVKALEMGIKFLTGDIQFRDIPNVEYVK